jgi:hypothetical protein
VLKDDLTSNHHRTRFAATPKFARVVVAVVIVVDILPVPARPFVYQLCTVILIHFVLRCLVFLSPYQLVFDWANYMALRASHSSILTATLGRVGKCLA